MRMRAGRRGLWSSTNNYCWDYKSIVLIPNHAEVIPADILESMNADPRKQIEGNLRTTEEFEAIVSHATIYRTKNADKIPAGDADAVILMGGATFLINENDETIVDAVGSFTRWGSATSLAMAVPP